MQTSSAFITNRFHNPLRETSLNRNKHAPVCLKSSFININSPICSYETIEHFDRELLNSLNRHDMKIIGNYLDTKKTRDDEANASRPISLLSVDSNDTIVDQNQESMFEDETEEETDEEMQSDFGDKSQESWRQKLDNLKIYTNQNSDINSNLNEQIESLHKALEVFLETKSQTSSDQVIYTEPFPVNFPTTATKNHLDSDFYAYGNDSAYPENIKNRLFFNFNNRNNSMYFSTMIQDDSMDSNNCAKKKETRFDEKTLEHRNQKTLRKTNDCTNSNSESVSTSILNRLFKMLFSKKQKFF